MIVCLKCNDCGNEFFVEDTVIKEYEARQKMANSLNTQAMFAGASQLLDQLSGKSDFSSMETYIKLRDINVLNAESKMLKNGNPFICPNCGSENTRFMTQKEINVYMENLQSEIEDKEKQEKAKNRKINPNATLEQLKERILLFIEDGEWYEAEHYVEHALDIATTDYYLYYLQFLIMNRCKNNKEMFKKRIYFNEKNNTVKKILKYSDASFAEEIYKHNYSLNIKDNNRNLLDSVYDYETASKKIAVTDSIFNDLANTIINKLKNLDIDETNYSFLDKIYKHISDKDIIESSKELVEEKIYKYFKSKSLIDISLFIENIEKLKEETIEEFNLEKIVGNGFTKYVKPKILNAIKKNNFEEIPISYGHIFLYSGVENSIGQIKKEIEEYLTLEIKKFSELQNIDNLSIDDLEKNCKILDSYNSFIDKFQLNIQKDLLEDLLVKFKNAKDTANKEILYNNAIELMDKSSFKESIIVFNNLGEYKDSKAKALKCNQLLVKHKESIKKRIIGFCIIIFIIIAIFILCYIFYINHNKKIALTYKESGAYKQAIEIYNKIGLTDQAQITINEMRDSLLAEANDKFNNGNYNEAFELHKKISKEFDYYVTDLIRADADNMLKNKKFDEAIEAYSYIASKKDILLCKLQYLEKEGKNDINKSYRYYKEAEELLDDIYDSFSDEYESYEYKKLKKLYEELFPWKIEILAVNSSASDIKKNIESANIGDTIYYHLNVTGGPPDNRSISIVYRYNCFKYFTGVYEYLDCYEGGIFPNKFTSEGYYPNKWYSSTIGYYRLELSEEYDNKFDTNLTMEFSIKEDGTMRFATPSVATRTIKIKR